MIDALARRDPRDDDGLLVVPSGRNHARGRLSDHLFDAKAEQARRPGVPTGDDPVETLADNRVGRGCDNRRKPLIEDSAASTSTTRAQARRSISVTPIMRAQLSENPASPATSVASTSGTKK